MANPRSLVYALYTHWDTVELLVRLSREFAVLTSDQVLNGIAKVSGQRDAKAQGTVLRALVNADILQTLPRSSDRNRPFPTVFPLKFRCLKMPHGRAPQICAHKGIYGHKFKGSHSLEAARPLPASPAVTEAGDC